MSRDPSPRAWSRPQCFLPQQGNRQQTGRFSWDQGSSFLCLSPGASLQQGKRFPLRVPDAGEVCCVPPRPQGSRGRLSF